MAVCDTLLVNLSVTKRGGGNSVRDNKDKARVRSLEDSTGLKGLNHCVPRHSAGAKYLGQISDRII